MEFSRPSPKYVPGMWRGLTGPKRSTVPWYELTAPHLRPRALSSSETRNGADTSLTLWYGDPLAAVGPAVSVESRIPDDHGRMREVVPSLPRAVADERDRLYDCAGIDEPDPDEPAEVGDIDLSINGTSVASTFRREGSVWAARTAPFQPGDDSTTVIVTVVARGGAPKDVALARGRDLGEYRKGRVRFGARIIRASFRRREVVTATPRLRGSAAIRAWLSQNYEDFIADNALPLDMRHRPRRDRVDRHGLWKMALAGRRELTGESDSDAQEALNAALNECLQLSLSFGDVVSEDALNAALADVIAWACREATVFSRGHELWLADRRRKRALGGLLELSPEERVERFDAQRDGRQAWSDAWQSWLDQR